MLDKSTSIYYNEQCSEWEGFIINTTITSKEEILETCRKIVAEQGVSSLNIRYVAQCCHVAIGSLYNYFPSKDALVMETIESVWQDIFRMECSGDTKLPFPEYAEMIFERIYQSTKAYPHFLTTHSVSIADTGKNNARKTMEHYLRHIKSGMSESLKADRKISQAAFSEVFTESDFIDFVLTHILTLLIEQKKDSTMLIEIIRRTVYFN